MEKLRNKETLEPVYTQGIYKNLEPPETVYKHGI